MTHERQPLADLRATTDMIRVVSEYRRIRRTEPNGDARDAMRRAVEAVRREEEAST